MRTTDNFPRIIAGQGSATGGVIAGQGFVIERTATGSYNVTLDPEYNYFACVANSHTATVVATTTPTNARTFVVSTFLSSTLAAVDATFSFMAAVH